MCRLSSLEVYFDCSDPSIFSVLLMLKVKTDVN